MTGKWQIPDLNLGLSGSKVYALSTNHVFSGYGGKSNTFEIIKKHTMVKSNTPWLSVCVCV